MKSKIKNYPIHVISAGNIETDSIEAAEGLHTSRTPPFFTKDPKKNSMGILTRQCTGHYKIEPIHKFIREQMGYKKGQRVKKGDVIGYVGNTGRSKGFHLHYEVLKDGKRVNPVNYFYGNLTADEFDEILKIASQENQSLD